MGTRPRDRSAANVNGRTCAAICASSAHRLRRSADAAPHNGSVSHPLRVSILHPMQTGGVPMKSALSVFGILVLLAGCGSSTLSSWPDVQLHLEQVAGPPD